MKKTFLLIITLLAALLASNANAKDGFYLGGNLNFSKATYKYSSETLVSPNKKRVSADAYGVGGFAGYKKSFDQVFIAPEFFYDYLNSSTENQFADFPNTRQNTYEIRSRYGIKANFGYDFTSKFSSYLTFGTGRIDQVNKYPSRNTSDGKWRTALIYGFGAQYNITDRWSVRSEFNTQRFNTPFITIPNTQNKVRLNVLNIGAVYSF
jgi:outer membrane autotransporter protein